MRLSTAVAAVLGAILAGFCAAPPLGRAQESPAPRRPAAVQPPADPNVARAYRVLQQYEGKSLDYRAVADAPDFGLIVEVSPEMQKTVKAETVREWVEAELERGAAKAVVLTREQQRQKYLLRAKEEDIFDHVSRFDGGLRYLFVELGAITLDDGGKVYQITVHFNRASLGSTGVVLSPVFTRSVYGYLGSGLDFKGKFKERVERQVQQFSETWTSANVLKSEK